MTVKEHYNNHLGNFYSWYTGDFNMNKNDFKTFCVDNGVIPGKSTCAIDLGAGNGIQTIALAELGFNVKAVDFNKQLIKELASKADNLPIEIIYDDLRCIDRYSDPRPELIVCCGDTLAHLESYAEIQDLLSAIYAILIPGGKVVLSFRDYAMELEDTNRFIPVKSDADRILTCFLEYFPDKVRVTDLLHERINDQWIQKVSSYFKTRISRVLILEYLNDCRFEIIVDKMTNRIITIIGVKIING
jgi:SAM-dependent methyltransferase